MTPCNRFYCIVAIHSGRVLQRNYIGFSINVPKKILYVHHMLIIDDHDALLTKLPSFLYFILLYFHNTAYILCSSI